MGRTNPTPIISGRSFAATGDGTGAKGESGRGQGEAEPGWAAPRSASAELKSQISVLLVKSIYVRVGRGLVVGLLVQLGLIIGIGSFPTLVVGRVLELDIADEVRDQLGIRVHAIESDGLDLGAAFIVGVGQVGVLSDSVLVFVAALRQLEFLEDIEIIVCQQELVFLLLELLIVDLLELALQVVEQNIVVGQNHLLFAAYSRGGLAVAVYGFRLRSVVRQPDHIFAHLVIIRV